MKLDLGLGGAGWTLMSKPSGGSGRNELLLLDAIIASSCLAQASSSSGVSTGAGLAGSFLNWGLKLAGFGGLTPGALGLTIVHRRRVRVIAH